MTHRARRQVLVRGWPCGLETSVRVGALDAQFTFRSRPGGFQSIRAPTSARIPAQLLCPRVSRAWQVAKGEQTLVSLQDACDSETALFCGSKGSWQAPQRSALGNVDVTPWPDLWGACVAPW